MLYINQLNFIIIALYFFFYYINHYYMADNSDNNNGVIIIDIYSAVKDYQMDNLARISRA